MRFSIIVPIYNTEKYLDKCIKSILNQTMSDYELILIDDCSTDDSLTIAYKYESNHVKVLKNASNSGLSETRNVGIKNASGDYIVFIDSDDYIEKTALFNLNKLVCENEFPDIVYTGFIEERGTSIVKSMDMQVNQIKDIVDMTFLGANLKRERFTLLHVLVFIKEN